MFDALIIAWESPFSEKIKTAGITPAVHGLMLPYTTFPLMGTIPLFHHVGDICGGGPVQVSESGAMLHRPTWQVPNQESRRWSFWLTSTLLANRDNVPE
ncbi:hypothetical protein [Geoalkalibacter subterraneus]|uniref:hypothetical protein n=1 Tax=Geoalkalibacter subterraneus TaxID=483547 RepID=UPI0011862146|nr:hypothetical protein [Geoalkalibacter subterraneus]